MYSETYAKLKNKYNFDNFEVIAQAIENHFSDLFKLTVLNDDANIKDTENSYVQLFDQCMRQLDGLFTVSEVVQKLYQTLQTPPVIDKLKEEFIFVPPIGLQPSKQPGFLEKMAVNDFKVAEPLTFIDMVRLVHGLQTLQRKSSSKVQVVQLNNLIVPNALDKARLRTNDALVINLNRDLKGMPKWGIIHLPQNGTEPEIYCETPLTEREKAEVQDALGMKFQEHQFKGATASSPASTGYMAISWLDNNVTHAWNFDTSADFNNLFKELVFTYFSGDAPGMTYEIKPTERARYCTPEFQHLLNVAVSKPTNERDFQGGYILTQIAATASLGALKGESFRQGDVSKVIQLIKANNWNTASLKDYNYKANRTLPPGFSATLSAHPGLVNADSTSVTLTIPEQLSIDKLKETHVRECAKTQTNAHWFEVPWDKLGAARMLGNNGADRKEEFYATMIVLALIRSKAKKRIISINLPQNYQLNDEEQNFVINALRDNPYVTEFKINEGIASSNQSLHNVQKALVPTVARNRWLATNGYRPPLVDNYWRQAARYWLIHLTQAAALLHPKAEHELFKNCVMEMGLQGLNAVLELLNDEVEREYFENLYGKDRPAFYAACQPQEYGVYLDTLFSHLQKEAYFPFGELGIAYQPKNNPKLVSIIEQLNKLKQFERITFTDCLKHPAECKDFLQKLIEESRKNQWLALIIIPELEDKANIHEATRELRLMYSLLNDIILKNRHQKAADEIIQHIEKVSNFAMPDAEPPIKLDQEVLPQDKLEEDLEHLIERTLGNLEQKSQWPLRKGGVVQLQLQQQQQIEQNYQMQQEQQKVVANMLEQAMAGELVDYTNIDRLLKKYWADFEKENPIKPAAATLRNAAKETLLQGFFHTWISANPAADAQQVIKKMTLEAAQTLLRKHQRLTSGLNPDNLPKGFYTQRTKDGQLTLCYSPELSYVTPPNALTIDLVVTTPQCEAWEGDFRQFDLDKYTGNISLDFDEKDWSNIVLFAYMQPPKQNYREDYDEFRRNNAHLAHLLEANKEKILQHWRVFLQTWHYAGAQGIDQFLDKNAADLKPAAPALKGMLLSKITSPEIAMWAAKLNMDEEYLRALGQIYYRYGTRGLLSFLSKLRQLEATLGHDFFGHFNQQLIARSANFNCFINENFFLTLDDMMERLKPREAQGTLAVWNKVLECHMHSLDWEKIESLWRGFSYFSAEIEQMGLKFSGTEFDRIAPENMLICMERILNSLNHIPDYDMQKEFLAHLEHFDLSYGGVPYALQHEGFKYFDHELMLREFALGSPTYAPDLTALYDWQGENATLKMKRTLASKAQFSQQAHKLLVAKLGNDMLESRDQLLWLLHTQYNTVDLKTTLAKLDHIRPEFQKLIAQHLFDAMYVRGNKQLSISLDALIALAPMASSINLPALLKNYPDGTVLEALSILYQSHRWSESEVRKVVSLLNAPLAPSMDYPEWLRREGYKLATLFAVTDAAQLQQFYQATKDLRPIVHNELKRLISQVLSIEYSTSNLAALTNPANWDGILECIKRMKDDMAHTSKHRIALIEHFDTQGIQFKYSKSGEFRALTNTPEDRPEGLGFFVDHEDRIWEFLQKHILIGSNEDANEALKPIVRFLKKLQLNRTYLNEIEPLLSSLEKMPEGHYWSMNYFFQLLRTLQPENDQALFPISLFKMMLAEETIAPKKINSVNKDFPAELAEPLRVILKNTAFDRNQQGILCQIALREYNWQGNVGLLGQIMAILSLDGYGESRTYALEILAKSQSFPELEARFENCRWLLQHPQALEINSQWTQTTALWLKALSLHKQEENLLSKIKTQFAHDPELRSLILHVVAFSTLRPGLRSSEEYQHHLNQKAGKLVDLLAKMPRKDLLHLAKAYSNQPSPTTEDIIHLLKKQEQEQISWSASFEHFARQPFSEPRTDYGQVTSTRDADLQRMILETKVSGKDARQGLHAATAARLTLIFGYLKQLESGAEHLPGSQVPIARMSPKELADAFQKLSKIAPQNDLIRAQIWAILFEVLGRTTHKYPHLAQQFALIANDIGLQASTRVLQLATGEGKSHFVALRAARNASQGKTVDVCTAKRTLAERDLEDYQSLFDYLGIKTAYIHPKSSRESYMDAQIHYSTLGDLSLFLDEQSYSGQSIVIDPRDRVALFDEFDFICFEEGRKTEYNYARPTGKTPKQMTWFYQSVNAFYATNQETLVKERVINLATLRAFTKALQQDASKNEERQLFIATMMRDPLQLIQWLQSAHEAFSLEWGVGFTVREENISLGEESYPMREIIPLSADNQKMVGSTFSAGVHQLLAVRLNTEARAKNKPQDFYIHPESHIISSQVAAQRMSELWGSWEGFSGTISAAQAATLNREQGTEVLHVPTNQRDLRFWHKPKFYNQDQARMEALVAQVKTCIEKKQSMLFSCKNDKQVDTLQKALKKHFSIEELKQHFIFYTNEEHRTAAKVLADKTAKEGWRGGKKQHAVGLVASGFGRGDNVEVEAVFLFDVNDTNDKLQKGGRTARNGAEGQVFQYYLSQDLVDEEQRLWDVVATLLKSVPKVQELKTQLDAIKQLVDGDHEQCFERVMLLREYVFSLQNAANQGHHNAIAQYSSWGMHILGSIEDPSLRQTLTAQFSLHLRRLDKLWIDISSQENLTVDDKIDAIEAEITQISVLFKQSCSDAELEVGAFNLNERQPTAIQMVVPQKTSPVTPEEHAIAAICSVMLRLPDLSLKSKLVSDVPQLLETLAGNPKRLKQFARESVACKSTAEFLHKLHLASRQVLAPSPALEELEQEAAAELAMRELFNGVADELRLRCERILNSLIPSLQQQLLEALAAPHMRSATGRIEHALPMMEYLSKFSIKQQKEWGADYISQLQALPHILTDDLLSLYLSTDQPMSYRHFAAFGQMIHTVAVKNQGLTQEETRSLYSLLINATKAEPEQRVRMLTRWESWSKYVPEHQVKSFLTDFCQAMMHFKEGENWDTFSNLVRKTQNWINKGGEAYHAPELVQMWQRLAHRSDELVSMNKVLSWAINLEGKSWFKTINAFMNLSPFSAFETHYQQFKTIMTNAALSKQQRVEQLDEYCQRTTLFYRAIAQLSQSTQEKLKLQFTHLETAAFDEMMQFIGNFGELVIRQPLALEAMLAYLDDPSLTKEKRVALVPMLRHVTQYQVTHPAIDYAKLSAALGQFRNNTVLLSSLLDYRDGAIHTVAPLMDGSASLLMQTLAKFNRLQQANLMQLLSKLNAEQIALIMKLVGNLGALAPQQPHTLEVMLAYVMNKHITPACQVLLSEAILHVTRYQATHASLQHSQLMAALTNFQDHNQHSLELLLHAMDFREEQIHRVDALMGEQFSLFAHIFEQLTPSQQAKLALQLKELDITRFDIMVKFIGNLGALAIQQPQTLPIMFAYLHNPQISMVQNELLATMIVYVSRYQAINTHFEHPELMAAIARFQDHNADTLGLLFTAMDSRNEKIHRIDPLINNKFYHQINLFYQVLAKFDKLKQAKLTEQLKGLDTERLQLMLEFMGNLGEQASQSVAAVKNMLAYCADKDIPVEASSVLATILMQVTRYQAANPRYNEQELLIEVAQFRNCSAPTLQLLLQAMDSREGTIHTLEPLLEGNFALLTHTLAQFAPEQQDALLQQITTLDSTQFKLLLKGIGDLDSLAPRKPQALLTMTSLLADKQISGECKEVLAELIVQITRYPAADHEALMHAVENQKHSSVGALQRLLKAMDSREGDIHRISPLLDERGALLERVIAQFGPVKQAEFARQLNELSAERFNFMLQFTNKLGEHLAHSRPRALETLLSCLKDPNITMECGKVFAELIFHTIQYEAENPHTNYEQLMNAIARFQESDEQTLLTLLLKAMEFDGVKIHTIEPLINNKCYHQINLFYQEIAKFAETKQAQLTQQLHSLNAERLQLMLEFMGNWEKLATPQPHAVEAMLAYLADDEITLGANSALANLLIQVSTYHAANPHSSYEQLMTAVARFTASSEHTLKFLAKTMDQLHSTEPLFDNVVFYMDKKVPATAKNSVLKVVELFYQQAKEEVGDGLTMSLRPEVTKLFNFNDDSKKNQSQRLIWMHLLQQQVFVKETATAEHHDYTWSHERNEQLLQSGFDHYLQHTKKVLEESQGKQNVHRKRDLSIKQQHELLKLADELSIIGEPKLLTPYTTEESQRKATDLSYDLNKLLHTYQGAWFKSHNRIEQAQTLTTRLRDLTTDAPRYHEVLQAISQAKRVAMHSDEEQNRNRWFMMNSSGQSRYFNTLNQMQDLVLRKWSMDAKEIHGFKQFTAHNQEEFVALVDGLQTASINYYEEHYPTPDSPRFHETRHKLGRFFGNVKSRTNLETLNTALASFSAQIEPGAPTARGVNELMDELRKVVSTLPGHLITLANEVLIRGDALALNLSEQADVEQLKGNISGGAL